MGKNKLDLREKLLILKMVYAAISIIALVVAITTYCIWQNKDVVSVCLIVLIICLFEDNYIIGFLKGSEYQDFLDNKKGK